jgi:hypothetical protein
MVSLPLISLIAVTRGMLGAGLGLLLADRLTSRQKRTAGWALFLAGAVSTVPLAARVLGNGWDESAEEAGEQPPN